MTGAAHSVEERSTDMVAEPAHNRFVRLSVNLSKEVADALRWIAEKHNTSITEAIRRAISTQTYIEEAHDRGAVILLKEKGDGPLRELVFVR